MLGAGLGLLMAATALLTGNAPSASATPPRTVAQTAVGDGSGALGLTGIDGKNHAERVRSAEQAAALGVEWVRLEASWWSVQGQGPDSWDWSALDDAVAVAHQHGLKVLFLVTAPPPWARPGSSTYQPGHTPADMQAFARYAKALVARYAPRGVDAYEIWNEPNLGQYWRTPQGAPQPNAAMYASMLKAVYPAMKSAASGITVVTGGLGPFGTTGGDGANISPLTFLKQLYDNGAQGYFDAVGWHPYTAPVQPSFPHAGNAWQQLMADRPGPGDNGYQASVRTLMSQHGDGGKKVWFTEMGAASAPAGDDGSVSEAGQARIYDEAIRLHQSYGWAGPMFFYTLRDSGSDAFVGAPERERHFGLYRVDGSAKPAVQVLLDVAGKKGATTVTPEAAPEAAPAPAPAPAPSTPSATPSPSPSPAPPAEESPASPSSCGDSLSSMLGAWRAGGVTWRDYHQCRSARLAQ